MYDVEIIRGTTNNFSIQIFEEETGDKYTPAPGDLLLFGVKKNRNDPGYIFVKSAPVESDGSAIVTIRPEDTADLICEKHFYDVGLETGSDFYVIIPVSIFRINNNIVRKGCTNG